MYQQLQRLSKIPSRHLARLQAVYEFAVVQSFQSIENAINVSFPKKFWSSVTFLLPPFFGISTVHTFVYSFFQNRFENNVFQNGNQFISKDYSINTINYCNFNSSYDDFLYLYDGSKDLIFKIKRKGLNMDEFRIAQFLSIGPPQSDTRMRFWTLLQSLDPSSAIHSYGHLLKKNAELSKKEKSNIFIFIGHNDLPFIGSLVSQLDNKDNESEISFSSSFNPHHFIPSLRTPQVTPSISGGDTPIQFRSRHLFGGCPTPIYNLSKDRSPSHSILPPLSNELHLSEDPFEPPPSTRATSIQSCVRNHILCLFFFMEKDPPNGKKQAMILQSYPKKHIQEEFPFFRNRMILKENTPGLTSILLHIFPNTYIRPHSCKVTMGNIVPDLFLFQTTYWTTSNNYFYPLHLPLFQCEMMTLPLHLPLSQCEMITDPLHNPHRPRIVLLYHLIFPPLSQLVYPIYYRTLTLSHFRTLQV